MQIQNINFSPNIYPSLKTKYYKKPLIEDKVTFSSKNRVSENEQYLKAQKYARQMKFFNLFLPRDLSDYNLDKLDGIQYGINIFKGLNMREIAFLFEDLHGIAINRGCSNQCLHCYANALPPQKEHGQFINKMSFEDFIELTEGIKELKKRIGVQPVTLKNSSYTDMFYDSDCMEIVLYDKQGKEHDLTELHEIFYDAIDYPSIFDTAGWNPNNKKLQTRAEKYVKYLADLDNEDKFYQINISLSPFNALYARALELGYKPENYSPLKSINKKQEDLTTEEKGEKLYKLYIDRMTNALFTFTPLIWQDNFSIIARPVDDSEENMKNFTVKDYKLIVNHILKNLELKYQNDLNNEKRYVKDKTQIKLFLNEYSKKLLENIDTNLIPAGRYKELYLKRNPDTNEKDFELNFMHAAEFNDNYRMLKAYNDLNKIPIKYLKIIDTNGKVYLYDALRLIPTEISLNLSTKDKITPDLTPAPEDFIITREMINKSK